MLFKKSKNQEVKTKIQDVNEPEFSWETARIALSEKSEHKAWLVAKIFGICFLLSLLSICLLMHLKTVEPYVIEVDNSTGMSEILHIANT